MSGLSEADALDAWRAAIAVQQRGWQLVPVELTEEIIAALLVNGGYVMQSELDKGSRDCNIRRPKGPTVGEGK